ncbi:unnamed protein product, partial [marine sediment metagenome]
MIPGLDTKKIALAKLPAALAAPRFTDTLVDYDFVGFRSARIHSHDLPLFLDRFYPGIR